MVDIERRNKVFHKGLEYEQSGDYSKAFETYCEAISLSPKKEAGVSAIYALAANIAYRNGSYEIAIMLCENGINACSTVSANYDLLGRIYLEIGERGKALEYLKQAEIVAEQEQMNK